MENGLEVASRKFDGEIEEIYLLEFIDYGEKLLIVGKGQDSQEVELKVIIWDLYNTGEVEPTMINDLKVKDLNTFLARTSGNILQIDSKGKVTSVLKKIENRLRN